MKKTEYTTMKSSSFCSGEVWRRVYIDEDGKRYIKDHGKYMCIENTPCIDFMVKD